MVSADHPIASYPSEKLFAALLLAALLLEGGMLILLPVTSVPVAKETKTMRITLAPPLPSAKPAPPIPKKKSPPQKTKRVTASHPPTPVALPAAPPEATNLLAAPAGTTVQMGWGDERSQSGGGSDMSPPRLLTRVDTDSLYTESMKAGGEEGDVVVDLWIDSEGRVVRKKLVMPSVWDDMNRVAMGVIPSLRFSPATNKGKAVPGKFELDFRFRIRNSG